jgi:hypothetical protein
MRTSFFLSTLVVATTSLLGCALSSSGTLPSEAEIGGSEEAITASSCPASFEFLIDNVQVAATFRTSGLGPQQVDQVQAVRTSLRTVDQIHIAQDLRPTATTPSSCRYGDSAQPLKTPGRLKGNGAKGVLTAQTDITANGERVRLVVRTLLDVDGKHFVKGGTPVKLLARVVFAGGSDASESYIEVGTATVSTRAAE